MKDWKNTIKEILKEFINFFKGDEVLPHNRFLKHILDPDNELTVDDGHYKDDFEENYSTYEFVSDVARGIYKKTISNQNGNKTFEIIDASLHDHPNKYLFEYVDEVLVRFCINGHQQTLNYLENETYSQISLLLKKVRDVIPENENLS